MVLQGYLQLNVDNPRDWWDYGHDFDVGNFPGSEEALCGGYELFLDGDYFGGCCIGFNGALSTVVMVVDYAVDYAVDLVAYSTMYKKILLF